MVLFNLVAAGSNMPEMGGSITPEGDTAKIIPRRFTFHDLRAYYTTQHKAQYGALPELHADSKTTAKIYDRSRVSARKGLG
jgi:hypothetical protein